MSSVRKTVLVIGATGKQGSSVIDAILKAQPNPPLDIIAVTRDPASKSAQRLAAKPNVSVIQGDLSEPDEIFSKLSSPPWGVFSVQVNSPTEEAEGKAMVNAAVAHGASFFVYASGDRGGPERSAVDPTFVKNFEAKFNIEKHLEKVVAASNGRMTYLILRPVTFMENISPDVHGKGFTRMWEQMGTSKKLQLISTRDIGWFAAQGFLYPERYENKALTLVGDELTQPEADIIFKAVTGKSMAMTPCLMGSVIKWAMKDTVGDMFKWFEQVGYGGNLQECKSAYPDMMMFEEWLKECSGFVERSGRDGQ